MKLDIKLYADAINMALKVDFLESSEELNLYAEALYKAMIWDTEVDKNDKIDNLMDRFIENMDADTFFKECEDYGIFFEDETKKIEIENDNRHYIQSGRYRLV